MAFIVIVSITMSSCKKWSETGTGSVMTVINKGGQTLGYDTTSGVVLLTDKDFAFKDLNKNNQLDPYEDWRLSAEERAKNLASKMSIEQIAGLMLYSGHQSIPSGPGCGPFGGASYGGKSYRESGAKASDLTDQQIKFLTEDNLRHVLVTSVESPEVAAVWNNNVQALCESIGFGIPANNSSDPRHRAMSTAEYNVGSAGQISMWPGSLGMAATFDPDVVEQFGEIASREYRALGITTALSPQIDMATEPRWSRVSGTFGESPQLSADMARAYVDGFQTSPSETVIADHLIPFTGGAMKLEGETKMASAVMPYYTISYDIDKANNENVGNSYNKYLINDLLRGKYSYDGVVCTDWGVTRDETAVDGFGTTCWGVETLSEVERHYKIIMAGVDQFGGNNDAGPVVEETKNIAGNTEFMKAGYDAQLKSIVMLKNINNVLPAEKNKTVYIPKRKMPAGRNFFGMETPASESYPINIDIVKKYFNVTENPSEADFALVVISSPNSGTGYDRADVNKGGNGYVPISLQYSKYVAVEARDPSIAGGDPLEEFTNRTYKGKTVNTQNAGDLKMVLDTKNAMKDKPVIVSVNISKPMVFAEFEKAADAVKYVYCRNPI